MPVTRDLVSQDNKDLIAWSKEELSDPVNFDRILNIIMFELRVFCGTNKEELKQKLFDKMDRASQEYSTPYMEHWKIKKEFEQEMIDLIGWKLVENFNIKFKKGGKI